MSTKGKFIIRKGNTDKELTIGHDAFPDVAGMEIVELLKTTDMDRLFALVDDYHKAAFDAESFDDPDFPDEPELFDYLMIKRAVRDGKTYTIADIRAEDETREDYSLQKQMSAELMQTILERLAALQDKILSADFINERRADKIVYRCSDVLGKIKETEEYIDLLGSV